MIHRYVQFKTAISGIYKSIQKIERREMERFGLKGPHVECLLTIDRHPGITAAQLTERLEKDKASVSRSLTELQRKALLHREPGYRSSLTLTEQGREVARQICLTANRAVEAASLELDDRDRAAFYGALDQIAAVLQNMSEEGVS